MEKLLNLIPLVLLGAILLVPFLCLILYKRRKLRTCLVFTHLWCMIAFMLFGMVLLSAIKRSDQRQRCADESRRLLGVAQSLRSGDVENSIKSLDSVMANSLHRTAYDTSLEEMAELDPELLSVWQEFKEYDDTYEIKSHNWGLLHNKLTYVPWSNFQVAIRKFEQIYGNGKIAAAPKIKMQSWITQGLSESELNGKVVLLDFWNTRCGPCIKSFPDLQKLHDNYQQQGLVVITCAGGDKNETKKFLDKHDYSFLAGMTSQQMWSDYAVRGNPSYFLINRNGDLVWGPEDSLPETEELEKLLAASM